VDTGGLHSGGGSTPPAGSPRREAQPRRLEVKHLLTDLETGTRSLDEVAALLTDDDRAFDLARVIGTMSGVPDAQVLKALLEPDVAGIAVACGSVGMSSDGFRAVLKLRAARLTQSARQTDRELKAFEELPHEVSEHAMRFLKARTKVA